MKNSINRLKILHVIWGLTPGGAERQLVTIAKHQAETHDVQVCCLECGGEFVGELSDAGIKVHILGKRPGFDFKALGKLISLLKENKIDVMHSHIWSANLWGRLAAIFAGTPVKIIHEHSMFSIEKLYRRGIDQILSWFTDAVICVSSEILHHTICDSFISSGKCVLIRNGIDLEKYEKAEKLRNMSLEVRNASSMPRRIAIIGALEPRKDHVSFIKAANRILEDGFDVGFLIVGDGPLRENLEEMVKNLGREDKIKFTGVSSDIPGILADTSIYVSSSLTEGISIAMLEAMAVGVPVVATAVGGNVELCGRNAAAGLLVPPSNSEALAGGIKALLECGGVGPVLAEKAKANLHRKFGKDIMNKRIDQLLENIFTKRKRSLSFRFKRILRWILSRATIFYRIFSQVRLKNGEIKILTYHRVREGFPQDRLSVSTTEFSRQMSFIANTGVPVYTISEALKKQDANELPHGAFVITFDDGYPDMVTDAKVILAEYDFSGTLYIPAGLVDSGGIIKRYSDEDGSRLLSWEECKSLIADGWEIGSHSMTHADLSDPLNVDIAAETADSKKLLEERLAIGINSFAYPSGKICREAVDFAGEAGYVSAVTVWPGSNMPDNNKYVLKRTEISADDNMVDFACKIKGGFDFYQRIKAGNKSVSPKGIA